ncbi:MAG: hypothetical protein AVDCRST_MAG23-2151 [uncultured Sphingosinicella sp.]|uniref:DOMON-like domain-containing protein n=1 Tax=uncultured Sphingosinicella sp. TaxID=478748 RepID=A0A6J4U663_9SPHN|nr:DOMON-like domain-containing protein [uncultured Sphingosinicella sp.]CAA9541862.1 MAG: hypothetical protein AVDCRST_MAG23-2151 [uncultured Sphingosinicella sp.]
MRRLLQLDPESVCDAVDRIEVEAVRKAERLSLRYLVSGSIDDLLLPRGEAPQRAHQLWDHSCFEVFLRPSGSEAYCEFNFAPSRRWAAYRFRQHRSGMCDIEVAEPDIDGRASDGGYDMRVELDLSGVPELTDGELWQVNISTIIEETNGRKSYWALAHPPGKADFHNPDCFVLDLPPAA